MHRRLLSREVEGNRLRFYACSEHTEGKNEAQPLVNGPAQSWEPQFVLRG